MLRKNLWLSLVQALEYGTCILVVGPEISTPGNMTEDPSARLTLALAEELASEGHPGTGSSLAAVAQQYEDARELGPDALRAVVSDFYQRDNAPPGPVHEALASLPFKLILSISHDGLLLKALRNAGKNPHVFRYNMRADKLRNSEFDSIGSISRPIIYNLFGDPQDPSSLVLSENDLLDFLIKTIAGNPPLPNSLVRQLKVSTASFLFIGFGLKQWYLRILLKVLLRQHELGRSGNVVATEPLSALPDAERAQTILFFQRGTRVELVDSDVETFLKNARSSLEARGGPKTEPNALFGRPPRIFISYASQDQAMALQLCQKLQRAGLEPWLDTSELKGGSDWNQHIETELESTDFVLVLYSLALARKIDSYVNKEIFLAEQRAERVRGGFLIPLIIETIGAEDRIRELDKFQTMPLRAEQFDADFDALRKEISREYQRRQHR